MRTWNRKIDVFMVPDNFLGDRLVEGGISITKIKKNVNPFFVEDYQPHYQQGRFILYVGRIVKQKGVFTLVKAMSRLSSESLPLYIVGDGEDRNLLQAYINRMNLQHKVRLLGPKWGDEVKELMRASRCLVVPSEWYDNLPLIICQSYATAKPVIASAINGIPEYVEHEVDGLLFYPTNDQDLAKCIERLNRDLDLVDKMAVNARRKAEQIFDFRSYWNALELVIKSLL